jgi:hypothetical protein
MTSDISLLVAAGVLLLSAWAIITLFFWLGREWPQPTVIVIDPIRDDVCRCYMCNRISAVDRLTPRNS